MTDRKYELGHERVGKLLFRYSTPAMTAMLANSLYNLVDTIFVGQGAGKLALAALAVSFPIQMFILAVAQVVGIGSASVISRSLGAGDARKAERTAGTSFAVVAVLSAVLMVLGLLFLNPLLRAFGATPKVLPYASDYLSIVFCGSIFFAFAVSSNNIVRSEGNAKVAMASMIIGATVNVVLDPILIFGLDMGIRGAALATITGQFCSFLFLCRYFLSGRSLLQIRRWDLKPDWRVLPEVFRIGASSFTRVAAGSAMAIVLNNSIAHYGGDIHLAVMGVTHRTLMVLFMPLIGLVHGLQPIVGFNYGARNMDRVRQAIRTATATATAISSAGFLLLMLFPRPVLGMFSSDSELLTEGPPIVRVMVICLPVVGFHIVGTTLFQAIGKAGPALFLSMSRQVLLVVPLVLILPLRFGLPGIWASFPLADAVSTLITGAWVLSEIRRLKNHPPPATDGTPIEAEL